MSAILSAKLFVSIYTRTVFHLELYVVRIVIILLQIHNDKVDGRRLHSLLLSDFGIRKNGEY